MISLEGFEYRRANALGLSLAVPSAKLARIPNGVKADFAARAGQGRKAVGFRGGREAWARPGAINGGGGPVVGGFFRAGGRGDWSEIRRGAASTVMGPAVAAALSPAPLAGAVDRWRIASSELLAIVPPGLLLRPGAYDGQYYDDRAVSSCSGPPAATGTFLTDAALPFLRSAVRERILGTDG